jgi:hypothetical protein
METKPSSFDAVLLAFPLDPHDVASPITRTPERIMLNSFIILKILNVKSHRMN